MDQAEGCRRYAGNAAGLADVAVANGTYTLKHRVDANLIEDKIEDKGIFTHVFERVRGNWVCINSQRTSLREVAPQAKAKKKSSDAELPFHIPFFQKSDKTNQ